RARTRDRSRSETRGGASPTGDRSSSRPAGGAETQGGRRRWPVAAPCERRNAARGVRPGLRRRRSRRLEDGLELLFLLARAFERAAGLREEDVVERRLMKLQVLDLHA